MICFSWLELWFEIYAANIYFSLVYKILRAIDGLFFSNLFQSSNCDE